MVGVPIIHHLRETGVPDDISQPNQHIYCIQHTPKRSQDRFGVFFCGYLHVPRFHKRLSAAAAGSAFSWIATVATALPPS